jgi:hypothetical protein
MYVQVLACKMETGNMKWTSPETKNLISDLEESSCLWNVFDKGCLCGLVVSVADYKHRGPGFDSRALLRIFLR